MDFFKINTALEPTLQPPAPLGPSSCASHSLAPDKAYQARFSQGGRTAQVTWDNRFIMGIRPYTTVGGAGRVRDKACPSLPEAPSSG